MGKPKFRLEDYTVECDGMHCRTEEEARNFCRFLHEHGRTWKSGRSYLEGDVNWSIHKQDTVYCFNDGTFTTIHHSEATILEYDSFDWSDDKPVVVHTEKTAQTQYSTGAVRDDKEGKGRCDLMPLDVVARLLNSEPLSFIGSFKTRGVDCLYDAVGCFAKEANFTSEWNDADETHMPNAMLELAKHFEEGAKHYGENNWQKGIPVSSYIDSAVRHYLKYKAGWTDEHHDRAFVWNIVCCIWTMQHMPEMDNYTEKGSKHDK